MIARAAASLVAAAFAVACAGCYDPTADDTATTDGAAGAQDLSATAGSDLRGQTNPHPDLAGGVQPFGTVGVHGGSVDRLLFGFSGDTRPTNCDDTPNYPSAVIGGIFSRMSSAGAQFAVTTGDHMYVCTGGQTVSDAQMKLYMTATQNMGGKPVFLTMGNHECAETRTCLYDGFQNANFRSFMAALAPISNKPYYSFDVSTAAGLARFVIVADNSWEPEQETWLTNTLTAADTEAKYTFVFRHHPADNDDLPDFTAIWNIIHAHKYSLFLVGHTHEYVHDRHNDPSGRTVILGLGGAPFDGSAKSYGYGLVAQQANGDLTVTIYDSSTNNQLDSFTVAPQ